MVLLLGCLWPLSFLGPQGALIKVAHSPCCAYRTWRTRSLTPPSRVQFPCLRSWLVLSFASCTFNPSSLLCPGLSFNCPLLLSAVPIFWLCCDLIKWGCSFQFKQPSIRVSSRLHFSIAPSNIILQVRVSTASTFSTINSTPDTKPKQRNLGPGLFQVALNHIKCPWHRVYSIILHCPNTLVSYRVPPCIITEIRIFWRLGNRWMKCIQVGRVWLALWILCRSCLFELTRELQNNSACTLKCLPDQFKRSRREECWYIKVFTHLSSLGNFQRKREHWFSWDDSSKF